MPGILTRKSNFSDLESFEDFQPKSPVAPISKPVTADDEVPEQKPSQNTAAFVEPESSQTFDPLNMANSRKEKADLLRLAQQAGYTINNQLEKPIPARLEPESNTFLKTVRIEVADWNRFQRWCHANSYSHKKGFKVLTQKLPAK